MTDAPSNLSRSENEGITPKWQREAFAGDPRPPAMPEGAETVVLTYDERMVLARRPWQRCPVCTGKGIVPQGFYSVAGLEWSSTSTAPDQCRSCCGKGMVR